MTEGSSQPSKENNKLNKEDLKAEPESKTNEKEPTTASTKDVEGDNVKKRDKV